MELQFDVKVTAGALYDYLLYHTYSSFSGIIGTIAGVFLLMVFLTTRYVIYLIAGVVMIGYLPCALFLKAKQQAQQGKDFATYTNAGHHC